MIIYIALTVVLLMVAIYALVIRGSLGLLSKRLRDDPDLAASADIDGGERLPIDVEY